MITPQAWIWETETLLSDSEVLTLPGGFKPATLKSLAWPRATRLLGQLPYVDCRVRILALEQLWSIPANNKPPFTLQTKWNWLPQPIFSTCCFLQIMANCSFAVIFWQMPCTSCYYWFVFCFEQVFCRFGNWSTTNSYVLQFWCFGYWPKCLNVYASALDPSL